jgi:peptide/nickel transport system permease protein
MATYTLRRLLLIVPVVFLVTVGVSALMRLVPGDPATQALGQQATDEDRQRFREAYHLDDPFFVQYFNWWGDVFQGNLGTSVVQRTNVTEELKTKLPSTLELLVLSVFFTLLIGIPAGILSALRQNSPIDYGVRFMSILGLSIPSFWLGTLVIVMPAIWWDYLPPLTRVGIMENPLRNLQQYSLPALVIAVASSAGIMRLTRSSVLEVLRNDYIRTAWAKGLTQRVIVVRHVLKNAMIPVITVLGLQVAALVGGAVIIEVIFNLPGLGTLFINSIVYRDYPVIQGLVLFLATIFLLTNLLVDLSYGLLDPRIRYS